MPKTIPGSPRPTSRKPRRRCRTKQLDLDLRRHGGRRRGAGRKRNGARASSVSHRLYAP